jgi:HAD superfamily phosphoserine phosphatase-like hydrolase
MKSDRLIVFDVEGVLLPKARFILLGVVRRMGFWALVRAALFGALYQIGLLSLKDALKHLYKPLKGLPLQRLILLSQQLPLMPGVETIFKDLKKLGFKTALISSGIPTIALENLAERLGVDYVSGVELGVAEGILTGEIWGDVIEAEGKAAALGKILEMNRGESTYIITIADDRNNLSLFKLSDLKIGFNSDFILSYRSDYVVKGDLLEILPIVKGGPPQSSGTLSKSTVLREAIHIGGFSVALVSAYLINRRTVALLILIVTVVYTISEILRLLGRSMPIISAITLKTTRKSEAQEFVSSPIFYALGIVIPLMFFPEPVGYASISVLTLGDGFASVCGLKFGRTQIPFNKNKRLEGSACGLAFAFLGSLLFVNPMRALAASAVGMFVEALPLPINDNLAVPFASGLALMILALV